MELLNNKYSLHRKLGERTMGEVWLATDTMLERLVAVKFLQAVNDPTHREMY